MLSDISILTKIESTRMRAKNGNHIIEVWNKLLADIKNNRIFAAPIIHITSKQDMMNYRIDVATGEDTETISKFQMEMAKESEGTELDYETVREGVKAVMTDETKGTYLVAKDGEGKILGSLLLTTEWSDWNNCPYYWIQSVYVKPENRRQGVFRELFDFARVIAQSEGAGALRLYVDRNNPTAKEVYRALGMKPSHYELFEL